MIAKYRLFQLISPSLPVGAFSYSQGLEWAIECGWVSSQSDLNDWLNSLAMDSMQYLELPVLRRLYRAFESEDAAAAAHWCQWLYASRETAEFRQEETQRGRTMLTLLKQLKVVEDGDDLEGIAKKSQIAGFALAGVRWGIDEDTLCEGYVWSWLENTVMAGVKLIPLGQTAGQEVLLALTPVLDDVVRASRDVTDEQVGGFAPAQAIASSQHETQYSRLFRS